MRLPALVVLIMALAAAALPAGATTQEEVQPRVVVSPIDSGINPYHEFFQVEESSVTQDVLDEFGIDASHVITLTTFEQDSANGLWDPKSPNGIKRNEAYHFTGTNIIGIDTSGSARPILPDSSGDTHGVGVSGSVVRGNPEAIIFFVEGTGAAGESLAFTHPSVDIVTTSYGFATAVPLFGLTDSYTGVVEQGKAHFGASPNDPSAASLDGTSGPWWGISMAGYAEGDDDGKEITSGSSPELVADFTQVIPYCQTCQTEDMGNHSGTSFATPLAAGLASKVLLEARRDYGHIGGITADAEMAVDTTGAGRPALTTWDLRHAMQMGAVQPVQSGLPILTYPTSPVANSAIVGFGALTPDPEMKVVERALGALGLDGHDAGAASAETCTIMNNHFDARLLAWDANITSDSFLGFDSAGYIYC